jgi:HK97 family phage prohead protease
MARFQHSDAALLGTTQARTLRLDVDSAGLNYEVDVPQSRDDVLELVGRGDVANSSIAFETWEDDWTTDNGTAMRTLLSGRLIDVAPVTTPAYKDTSVAMRSLADYANADPADVLDLAAHGELRKLLSRQFGSPAECPARSGCGRRRRS